MRITVNLASRPFVELGPLFVRLRIVMAALAVLAIGLTIGLRVMSKRVNAAEAQMGDLQAKTTTLVNERHANEARMRQPVNQAVLERSRFLNDVFQRKSFSWTAVMMDLENVLPAGVQVTNIEPGLTPDGSVNIRLRVSGERDREVDLMRNLERSQRFVAPRLINESTQQQEQGARPAAAGLAPGAVEFDILSGYNPLPAQKAAAAKGQKVVSAPADQKQPRPAKRTTPRQSPPAPAPQPGGTR